MERKSTEGPFKGVAKSRTVGIQEFLDGRPEDNLTAQPQRRPLAGGPLPPAAPPLSSLPSIHRIDELGALCAPTGFSSPSSAPDTPLRNIDLAELPHPLSCFFLLVQQLARRARQVIDPVDRWQASKAGELPEAAGPRQRGVEAARWRLSSGRRQDSWYPDRPALSRRP